jgi:NAD(P)-dependent dehydrogenase (short-subunit alcohol dehydrogenase family)
VIGIGRLDGKVSVITGAASGIGRESARRFAAEGARVCVVDVTDQAGEQVAEEVDGLYLHADVTDPDQVQAMYAKVAGHFGGIDVLFNNAGIAPADDVSVVATSSPVAVMGAATSQISYTASKGGVLALSRELGVELARRGVRVNALCPGPVNTPLLQELFAKDPEKAARRLVHLPMGRFAEAAEIAAAACFLASDDASYITASTFLVDGGLSAAYVTPE